MNYSETLNLPRTDFPMRANLPQREPEILKFWDEIGIYRLVQQRTAGRPLFILHDGPPYANGHIHLGHVLNKVLKDIIVKFHSMSGFDAPYVPGWDTHGLPIEQQAIKELGIDRHAVGPVEFRKKCRDYALRFVAIQREEFKRLGVRGDWDNPYLTLQPHFEAKQLEVFGEMARKGYIYKGLRAIYWCATCETALADAEVEYREAESPAIYVRFAVIDGKGILPQDAYIVIWTTTPWTLPANVAICLHPDYTYLLAAVNGEQYLAAEALWPNLLRALGAERAEPLRRFKGEELEGVVCRHPFVEDREAVVVLDEYVSLEQGTGCVHIAPGHGTEDFEIGRRYNLPVISPVDARGYFTEEGGVFAGKFYLAANADVLRELAARGALLRQDTIIHQYPHCWRCKNPVFFRATEQWFASIDGFRADLLAAIDRVKWIPSWGRDRIYNMVANRSDWCISRQRFWGVPLPIFYCTACGRELISPATIAHLQDLFREHGSDIWFACEAAALLPPGTHCPACGGTEFTKETDTMDVWFDSGSSHWAVLTQPEHWPGQRWPADLYLEGSDQHRGWFNSSLTTAVAVTGDPPYRAVLTHGFVVDEQGRKMSKSLGNVVDPLEVVKDLGADILRLWVCSADYRSDLAVSPGILAQTAEAYRKIRNTFRFLLGNLYDYDPASDAVPYDKLLELDRFALLKLQRVVERVVRAYADYEFHLVAHTLYNYCVTDLSAFYLNVLKDRLYCEGAASRARRSAQTVLHEILLTLVKLLAPVLAFTTEEVWRHVRVAGEKPVSVQLCDMPQVQPDLLDPELEVRWERLLAVRDQVLQALEPLRREKVIRDSLEAEVKLFAGSDLYRLLDAYRQELPAVFIVSAVEVLPLKDAGPEAVATGLEGLYLALGRAAGEKCPRCWVYSARIGTDREYPEVCPRCAGVLRAGK
ncbi:MAG: isoleucine--tRNA ligase [Bacillota bacterium]